MKAIGGKKAARERENKNAPGKKGGGRDRRTFGARPSPFIGPRASAQMRRLAPGAAETMQSRLFSRRIAAIRETGDAHNDRPPGRIVGRAIMRRPFALKIAARAVVPRKPDNAAEKQGRLLKNAPRGISRASAHNGGVNKASRGGGGQRRRRTASYFYIISAGVGRRRLFALRPFRKPRPPPRAARPDRYIMFLGGEPRAGGRERPVCRARSRVCESAGGREMLIPIKAMAMHLLLTSERRASFKHSAGVMRAVNRLL